MDETTLTTPKFYKPGKHWLHVTPNGKKAQSCKMCMLDGVAKCAQFKDEDGFKTLCSACSRKAGTHSNIDSGCCSACKNRGISKRGVYKGPNDEPLCSPCSKDAGTWAVQKQFEGDPLRDFKIMESASKDADKKSKRWTSDEMNTYGDYITVDRLEDLFIMQRGECYYKCGQGGMLLNVVDRSKEPNAVSVERIDNTVPHTIENCVLVHSRCNYIRQDHYTFDFMVTNAGKLRRRTHSFCQDCSTLKTINKFGKDKSHCDGFNTYCKQCRNIRNRATKAKCRRL